MILRGAKHARLPSFSFYSLFSPKLCTFPSPPLLFPAFPFPFYPLPFPLTATRPLNPASCKLRGWVEGGAPAATVFQWTLMPLNVSAGVSLPPSVTVSQSLQTFRGSDWKLNWFRDRTRLPVFSDSGFCNVNWKCFTNVTIIEIHSLPNELTNFFSKPARNHWVTLLFG